MNLDFDINSIIALLTSAELQARLFPVKIVFLGLSLFLLGFIIFILLRTHYLEWMYFRDIAEFLTHRPFGARRITRSWNRTLRRLETGSESEYKLAVIEADTMLDNSLKRMGYAGQTLEERLNTLSSATLPNIEQVYQVHKLRNDIVRDPDYRLSLDEARRTLEAYQEAFRHLRILEF